jgi:hypothetical protein
MDPKREPPAEAPPDVVNPLGGYTQHGSYMTPEQAMERHAADRAAQAPAPHRELDRDTRCADAVWPVWMLRAATLFIAITTFFFRHPRSDRALPKHG